MTNHIDAMAEAIDDALGGDYPLTYIAQAAYDALIDAVPDLVWRAMRGWFKRCDTEFGRYEIDIHDTLSFTPWGRPGIMFLPDTDDQQAAANAHNRTQLRKVLEIMQ